MASFKDTEGREWQVAIDAISGMRVRNECDKEFLLGDDEAEATTLQRLGKDRLQRLMVIQLLCDSQRVSRNLSVEQFWDALHDGDTVAAAGDALTQAIVNFTPPHKRSLLQAMVDKQREVEARGAELGAAQLNDPAMNQKLDSLLQERLATATENALTHLANA
mgnify:CR=1 FL=1